MSKMNLHDSFEYLKHKSWPKEKLGVKMLICVTTLALSSQPRQGHGKVWVKSATQESHSHSRECSKMWRNEPTHSKWTPALGVRIPMNFWIFKKQYEGSKLIGEHAPTLFSFIVFTLGLAFESFNEFGGVHQIIP
jgi:hypothetical protein